MDIFVREFIKTDSDYNKGIASVFLDDINCLFYMKVSKEGEFYIVPVNAPPPKKEGEWLPAFEIPKSKMELILRAVKEKFNEKRIDSETINPQKNYTL